MRINNVSTKTSKSSLIALSIFTFVITTVLIVGYISSSNTGISPGGFFRWLVDMFQVLKESSDEPIFPLVILTSIVGIYMGFIASVISRYQAIKKFNRELNIKYINLLPGGIEFFYTQPSNNFRCAYEDIKNLYMDIHSKIVRTKHGSRIVFEQLNLTFTDLNGKKYKLSNTTPSPMKLIYKIIDYTRRVQNFEYEFFRIRRNC